MCDGLERVFIEYEGNLVCILNYDSLDSLVFNDEGWRTKLTQLHESSRLIPSKNPKYYIG